MSTDHRTTLRALLRSGVETLEAHGVPNATRNAEWILRDVLGCDAAGVYARGGEPAGPEVERRFRDMIRRRAAREPLQYVLGGTEFMSLAFEVPRGVFVPRPETEVLAERAEALLRGRPVDAPARVLDLCCGTGVLAVSLARRLPWVEAVAVDVDAAAVRATEANAGRHGVEARVRVVRADAAAFLEGVTGRYDLVVCNPPYVPAGAIDDLPPEVRRHEPRRALDGGADGLAFYRRVAPHAGPALAAGGAALFEVGDGQAVEVGRILRDGGGRCGGGLVVRAVHRDLAGWERVVEAAVP